MIEQENRTRFARQLVLEGVGEAGQERLANSRALVVGAGGLGSPACYYLAAAGVGTLGVVDCDRVGLSNLNRQVLYTTDDLGQPKAAAAAERLAALNPQVRVIPYAERLGPARARELAAAYDVVLECSDTFATKFLVNEACVTTGTPLVWASVLGWEGQMSVVLPAQSGPCYRCLFPTQPCLEDAPTAREVGILGAVAGTMGAWQAVEALKLLLGVGTSLAGRLVLWDGWLGTTEIVTFAPRAGCPVCG
ncbi:MAG: HesA/MoeB/ThiF family protein [Anaerolineae bacterium]|nr:HesA/MoeB/ThiF family protein [Anaerolineae bacterium]